MPNWCSNYLKLEHDDPKVIRKAAKAFAKGKFLQTLIPNPDKEWNYDWSVTNWGTKWDVGDKDGLQSQSDNELVVTFESAWAPPTGAYEKLVDQGYSVYATYYEPGMAFAGVWDNGVDDYYEISGMSSQEVKDTLPQELDEGYGISECMAEYEAEQEDEVTTWYKEGVEECGLKPHEKKNTN